VRSTALSQLCFQVCIRAIAQTECIGPMKIAMKIRRDMIGVACDALMKMFQVGDDELIEQVFLTYLLTTVDAGVS
jgi:DnaJ homolog subfamily C member 13